MTLNSLIPLAADLRAALSELPAPNTDCISVDRTLRPRNPRRFQGMDAPRAAAKREYHSSRLREMASALAQDRNRSGRVVPNTGWIFAGCLSSHASRMASGVVS